MDFKQFKKQYHVTLNTQQEEAVLSTKGAILLLAVPGSGKTTVIVSRIGYMIYCLGVNPSNILTLTYSVAATNDMQERFCRVFGSEESHKLEFRTIHSFCVTILKEYEKQNKTKAFTMIQNSNEVMANLYYSLCHEFANEGIIKEIATQISYCKNKMLNRQEIQNKKIETVELLAIYDAYATYKRQNKVMDFDDQLQYSYQILKTCPEILKKMKQHYQYINVDEAQDTSKLQHAIIRLLVNKNIFMVGDEDQSIYQFRAAYPEALLQFKEQYKNAQVLLMETNYRSTKQILAVANTFIKQNKNRMNKTIIPNIGNGKPIKQVVLSNIEEHYKYIVRQAKRNKQKLAILYRNNDSAIPIIQMLHKKNIPFNLRGQDSNFFCDKITHEIKEFILFSKDTTNKEAFKKLYYKINCGISKQMIKFIQNDKTNNNVFDILLAYPQIPLWQMKKIINTKREMQVLKNKSAYEILYSIFNKIGYKDYLKSKASDSISENRYHQKINILYWLSKQNKKMEDFLTTLSMLESFIRKGSQPENASIVLSTIHASKGLEYDKVILMDVIGGNLPCVSKPEDIKTQKQKEQKEQYEEEVRLFYVGMTRARKELEIVSYQNGYEGIVTPSEFIQQIGKK